MIHAPNFEKSVETMVRALTFVSDSTDLKEVPTVQKGNELRHTIGLGAMGLNSALAVNKIHYDSKDAVEFTDAYFRTLSYYAIKASNKIAREREKSFFEFDKSKYADGTYFDKYLRVDEFSIESDKVKEALKGIPVPTKKDWEELRNAVMKYGMYNAYLLAIAPTGSISYVNEASASLHPITHLIEERKEKMTGNTYYPAPYLSDETIPYYKSAYDMDQRRIIDVYAAAQQHIDQGMSLTLFMRSTIPTGLYEWKEGRTDKMTTRDLSKLRNYAWTKGIKTLYYVRTYTDDDGEVGINECTSCAV